MEVHWWALTQGTKIQLLVLCIFISNQGQKSMNHGEKAPAYLKPCLSDTDNYRVFWEILEMNEQAPYLRLWTCWIGPLHNVLRKIRSNTQLYLWYPEQCQNVWCIPCCLFSNGIHYGDLPIELCVKRCFHLDGSNNVYVLKAITVIIAKHDMRDVRRE